MRQPSDTCEWCETHPYSVCPTCHRRGRRALELLNTGLTVEQAAQQMNLTRARAQRLLARELDRADIHRYRQDTIPVADIQALIAEGRQRDAALTMARLARLAGHKSQTHFERVLGYVPHAATTKSGKRYPARVATTIDVESAAQIVKALGVAPHEVPAL